MNDYWRIEMRFALLVKDDGTFGIMDAWKDGTETPLAVNIFFSAEEEQYAKEIAIALEETYREGLCEGREDG